MVKPREIRYGNWFKVAGRYTYIAHWKDLRDLSYYEQIPLTPEILEKCGFVINRTGGHYNNIYLFDGEECKFEISDSSKVSKFRFCYEYFKDENGKKYFRGLNYLHELQNLIFILTGKELEINL
jgi:hypothetical protein